MPRKILRGRVICDATDKTVSVLVNHRVLHPVYKKYINYNVKFLAHDELNRYKVGDIISIRENKPISKRKSWVVMQQDGGSV